MCAPFLFLSFPAVQPLGPSVGGELSSVLQRLVSSDWGERYAAVAELEELVQHNPTAVSTAVVKVCVHVCMCVCVCVCVCVEPI